jgi:hypothetical protein
VTLTVNTSEAVTVTGTPTLTLNDGGTATYVAGSGTSALTFSYTAAAGQNTADLSILGLSLNGGTIVDLAGNAASLSGATAYNPAGILAVDTTAPSVLSMAASGHRDRRRQRQPQCRQDRHSDRQYERGGDGDGRADPHPQRRRHRDLHRRLGQRDTDLQPHGCWRAEHTRTLAVLGLNLNAGTIRDAAGTAADLSNATGYNPAGTALDRHDGAGHRLDRPRRARESSPAAARSMRARPSL